VRGFDLYDNTPRQQWLQQHLGFAIPTTLHLPLLVDADGDKLAKSRQSLPVEPNDAGLALAQVLRALGQEVPDGLHGASIRELLPYAVAHWDPSVLRNVRSVTSSLR